VKKRPPSPPASKPLTDGIAQRNHLVALEGNLARYEQGLVRLPSLTGNEYEENVREILLARDAVADALAGDSDVSPATFKRVADSDQGLKENAVAIRNAVGANKLVSWREVRPPATEAWWWFLDERADKKEEEEEKRLKYNVIWILLTFFFATLSVSFLTEILRRFFLDEGGWDSVLGSALQMPLQVVGALLGLLTAGTLAEPVRHGVQGFLSRAGLFKKAGAVKRFAFALAFFCLVLPVWLLLPFFAHYYNDRGGRQVRSKQLSEAMESYERAIKLKPEYAEAHYNLADLYERFHKCQEAIPHYDKAYKLDNTFTHAQNNHAHLLLKCGNDEQAKTASAMLEQQLGEEAQPDDVWYSLLKNLGWAKFKLKNYAGAESDLRQAVAVRENGGSARCLLAQTLEAQGRMQEATDEWIKCFEYSGDPDVEATWKAEAEQRYRRNIPND
jgi:tetratricopeptide (TPR) repeat protein